MTVDEAQKLTDMPREAVLVVITNGEVRIGEVYTAGGKYVARRYRSREADSFDTWLAAVGFVGGAKPGKG